MIGFYDVVSPEELRARAEEFGYDKQQEAIAPFVESVGTDGFFEIVEVSSTQSMFRPR